MKLKPYVELECNNIDIIAKKILAIIEDKLDKSHGWIFLDSTRLLKEVPELLEFFKSHGLYLKHSAVTILQGDFDLHIDVAPTIAKINFPILNTNGWVNRWYDIDYEALKNCPRIIDEHGYEKEDITQLDAADIKLCAELYDFKTPIVFNSRIGHSVVQIDKQQRPRVVASFTFINEPLHFLK